jgi:dihydroorotate dehydrogenase (NAD+) catalytic subunit
VFENVYAGVSGPAILPIALRMVHQVAHAVKIPVVGMGGITSAEDALQFLMAGAVAVQVGTMTFANPEAMLNIIDGLAAYCASEHLNNLQEIVGII